MAAPCFTLTMPSPDPEPENYSIDDMMDRLRSRGEGGRDGEAELVTREDGTQVYRMRKRKRRSRQPKKEKEKRQRRFRVAQVVIAVALVLVTGLAMLGSIIYLNSAAYRESILSRIRTWTGAEPQVTQFRVTPVSAAAGSVELTWPESSMLNHLKLSGVRGDLRVSSIFGGAWKGAEMVASDGGTLVLRAPGGLPAAPAAARSGDCPFQFRFRSPRFSVVMGDGDQAALRLTGSEATLALLDRAATTANLQFEGGALNIAGWGNFGLNFASLQFEPSGIRLGNLRLAPSPGGKGEIEILNPEGLPLQPGSGETELKLRVSKVPLAALLGPAFGNWISATVEMPDNRDEGIFRFQGGKVPSFSLKAPFRSTAASESSASALPLFGILAEEIKESWYRSPRFDLAFNGTVVRDAVSSGLEELNLEARGRLTVTGRVMADAKGALDGTLGIGIPESALADAQVPFRRVFSRRDAGYAWAEVRISGTGARPTDDLEEQIRKAATTVPPASGGAGSLEDEFRELTTPEDR